MEGVNSIHRGCIISCLKDFKIISKEEFEEIQVLGNTYSIYHFKAKILPDRNLIEDLRINYKAYCDVISEKEYETIKEKTTV